jgi:hypothetical protein
MTTKTHLPTLIGDLCKRAQEIGHYNSFDDEFGIKNEAPLDQALFCFLVARKEASDRNDEDNKASWLI